MEIQPPQSVQINFNNKIITLHNVTIVKNPKIITIDAQQYSNFLKGSPVKLANGTTASTPLKVQMPSLVPVNKSSSVSQSLALKTSPFLLNQTPVIKQASNGVTPQVIRTIQPKNGLVQLKTSPTVIAPSSVTPVKFQSLPVKQQPTVIISPPKISSNCPTVKFQIKPQVVSAPGLANGKIQSVSGSPSNSPTSINATPVANPVSSNAHEVRTIVNKLLASVAPINFLNPAVVTTSPTKANASSTKINPQITVTTAANPNQDLSLAVKTNPILSVPVARISPAAPACLTESSVSASNATISSPPKVTSTHANLSPAPVIASPTPVIVRSPAKVIISPPYKKKTSPCEMTAPDAKRPCRKLDLHCIFCKDSFDDSNLLVDHMKQRHAESLVTPDKVYPQTCVKEEKQLTPEPPVIVKSLDTSASTSPETVSVPNTPKNSSEYEDSDSDDGDDDESEVNDLIMDLEDTQDTEASSQERTDTPESPEFEEHVPLMAVKKEPLTESGKYFQEDFDYDDYEYSSIMEPICELNYEEDFNDVIQDENEAMRLYREAMEMNYQQNGIKKRGRRRQRSKPLMENTESINGILAGLLENPIKVPPGPGRGRRKEINEQELEMDRSNGVCLFSCNKCDESFKYAGDLAKHVRSHTISSPYQCSICQRKFTHIGSLNTHLRIHSGERPYKCNQCDKSFTQSNSLMVHVKSHLSNKPFQCHQCNKGFLNASSLAIHTKTHTGPTTVTCPIDTCGKEFRDNNLLEEHMMTHRQSMLYQCSLCSEKFEQSCLLVQHVKSHIGDKPFQCNQCGKCFTQPGSLNTHLRIHTGEKPFGCTVCGKRFTQASSLSVHMKVHGEKEFKCVIENCKKSYSQEAYLKKHMLKHMETNSVDENNHIVQE